MQGSEVNEVSLVGAKETYLEMSSFYPI